MATFLRACLWGMMQALYPSHCVCIACGRPRVDEEETQLCDACQTRLRPFAPPHCPRCGCTSAGICSVCQRSENPALQGAGIAGYPYAGVGGRMVRALKFFHVRTAAQPLAEGLFRAFPNAAYDALVPVPLHRRRLRTRGFNQAALLCEALSVRCGLPVLHALRRKRATRQQARLSARARIRNTQNAFTVTAPVAGLRLLLVDDVRTTGATFAACADALTAAGARTVTLAAATLAQEILARKK
ncbi:MAG: ComF family protein [Clostridia bacterium]